MSTLCTTTFQAAHDSQVDVSPKWPASPEYYNSAITVSADGETLANYRKSFLYYTDETWALEGPDGFYDGEIEGLGNVAMGICKWSTRSFECGYIMLVDVTVMADLDHRYGFEVGLASLPVLSVTNYRIVRTNSRHLGVLGNLHIMSSIERQTWSFFLWHGSLEKMRVHFLGHQMNPTWRLSHTGWHGWSR